MRVLQRLDKSPIGETSIQERNFMQTKTSEGYCMYTDVINLYYSFMFFVDFFDYNPVQFGRMYKLQMVVIVKRLDV